MQNRPKFELTSVRCVRCESVFRVLKVEAKMFCSVACRYYADEREPIAQRHKHLIFSGEYAPDERDSDDAEASD